MLIALLTLAAGVSIISSSKEFNKFLIIYYLGGIIFSIASSIEVFWFFDNFHDGDQDFFITSAMNFFDRGVDINDIGINYFFYQLFVYLSSPINDYMVIAIFAKICFSLIWGMVLFLLFNKKEAYSPKEKIIILLLTFIGWYYSTFVLRDGFAALGFMVLFGSVSTIHRRLGLAIIGVLLLSLTRIHIPLVFLLSLFLFYIIYSIKLKLSPSIFVIMVILLGVLLFKIAPIPKTMVASLGIALLPDGESAESALPFPRRELALTYVQGDQEAKDTMLTFWIKRFPSIFYEPNPFRYFFWPFMGELGKETFLQGFTKSISSFSSIIVLAVFLSTLFMSRSSLYASLGGVYLFLTISLFLIGSIYAIKYFGMTTRIYYGFLAGYLAIFYFKPINNLKLNNNFYPIFLLLLIMNFFYFIIKPFNWIWSYL